MNLNVIGGAIVMIFIQQGMSGPRVVMLQCVLRRAGNAGLRVDGVFGHGTRQAVVGFQGSAVPRLTMDGSVGPRTWVALSRATGFSIVDVVDIVDPSLQSMEVVAIRNAGGDPIILRGMSNGVGQAVQEIFNRLNRSGTLAMVRFHSHGVPGAMNVSAGNADMDIHLAGIATSNIARTGPILARLNTLLAMFGCIDFMGCNVGQGIAGRSLLRSVAQFVGRPATAGVNTQYALATGFQSFNFEGPVVTAYPNNRNRANWAHHVAAHA